MKREVSKDDKLFYFGKHFFTLDGLWMIETEEETNWETALKIDTKVWIKLLRIIIRRIKRRLNIETNSWGRFLLFNAIILFFFVYIYTICPIT